jgi:LPXTG-motif cell wall-anchored protein
MKLYDAAFEPVIAETADTHVNALVLVVAVVIVAGVILLVLRKRRKGGKKGKSERSEDK